MNTEGLRRSLNHRVHVNAGHRAPYAASDVSALDLFIGSFLIYVTLPDAAVHLIVSCSYLSFFRNNKMGLAEKSS